ncbi:MAG: hypothetical protein AB7C96_05640 [Hydrogenovibrio sp.]
MLAGFVGSGFHQFGEDKNDFFLVFFQFGGEAFFAVGQVFLEGQVVLFEELFGGGEFEVVFDAGNEFFGMKGLGDVIDRTEPEPLADRIDVDFCGQEDNGDILGAGL